MRRGEVWWTHFGKDRRPALVMTRNAAIEVLSWVTVVPITRTIRGAPTEVRIGPREGMRDECVLTADNASTVPKGALTGRITRLPEAIVQEVCEALGYALGC